MRNYRRILRSLEIQALRDYVEVIEPDRSNAELDAMPREELIAILESDDCEWFSEIWEMEHEDSSHSIHPDETDEEFYEHEAPDKD